MVVKTLKYTIFFSEKNGINVLGKIYKNNILPEFEVDIWRNISKISYFNNVFYYQIYSQIRNNSTIKG